MVLPTILERMKTPKPTYGPLISHFPSNSIEILGLLYLPSFPFVRGSAQVIWVLLILEHV